MWSARSVVYIVLTISYQSEQSCPASGLELLVYAV
jgi:hypothetical protein